MKALLWSCVIVSCAASASLGADPKDSSKKKAGTQQKVSARDLIAKSDADSDRKLNKTELHNALRSLKFNKFSTKTESWKQFDTDKDEKLESKELDALLDANAAEQAKVEAQAEADAAKSGAKGKDGKAKDDRPKMTLRPPGT